MFVIRKYMGQIADTACRFYDIPIYGIAVRSNMFQKTIDCFGFERFIRRLY